MKNHDFKSICRPLLLLIIISMLNACASTPKVDPRVNALQSAYDELAAQPELASRAIDEMSRAEKALRQIQQKPKNMKDEAYDYALYATDRLIQIAEFSARRRYAEDRRQELVREQERLIITARTREAERAKKEAEQARLSAAQALALREEALALREQALAETAQAQQLRTEAEQAQLLAEEKQLIAELAAESALSDAEKAQTIAAAEAAKAEAARAEAEAAKLEMRSLRNQLSELEAQQTDRGLLITLGDVLFEFNQSELKSGAARNLMPLAKALIERPQQTVVVEGHTDSVGSKEYNKQLSERRAVAVKDYLVAQGIALERISTQGLGPDFPIASNNSEGGRQQNRRVEVILPTDTEQ
ncbi:OmpA family protein [Marinicella sp. W31]|uniref:OmpA family protein n=1 Tax=Marinicella sp. W31 TaxID=3023713 RepID=UPI0037574EF8